MKTPVCPSCGFVFPFRDSWKYFNPYDFACPQCRVNLRIRQANLFFSLSALLGLAIVVAAIACEEAGVVGIVKFSVVAGFVLILPFSVFLWTRSQYVLQNEEGLKLRQSFGYIILLAFNVLYAVVLLCVTFIANQHHPLPVAQAYADIESSTRIEDLRPRALYALNAVEASDKVIVDFQHLVSNLCILGVGLAVVNGGLVCYFLRSRLNEPGSKV